MAGDRTEGAEMGGDGAAVELLHPSGGMRVLWPHPLPFTRSMDPADAPAGDAESIASLFGWAVYAGSREFEEELSLRALRQTTRAARLLRERRLRAEGERWRDAEPPV